MRRMRLVLVCGLLLAGAMQAIGAVAADPSTTQSDIPRAEQRIGRTDSQRKITLAVPLKVKDAAGLDAFIKDLYDPSSPTFHHYLTPKEYTARFLDSAARTQVTDYLRGQGFAVTDSGLGSIVNATGTAATVERAFNVTISDYRDAKGGTFFANDKTPALSSSIASQVHGILGLDNAATEIPHYAKPPLDAAPAPQDEQPHYGEVCQAAINTASRYHSYYPSQLADGYGFTSLFQSGAYGQSQTIALFELDDYRDANVATYQSCFGTSVPVSRVPVDGGSTLGSGEVEVELDIDVIAGMAPLLSHLYVYEAPNGLAGIVDQYQRIANDNLAQVVSTSWGSCEAAAGPTKMNAENAVFQQMAVQGQSIFAAAGNSGSQDCLPYGSTALAVDNPASQPYVTGVGGTTAIIASNFPTESVWKDAYHIGAGGGGISTFWAKPSYQVGPGTVNTFSNGMRQVPDVSASADPTHAYTVFVNDPQYCPTVTGIPGATDCFEPIAGTSAATPFWAAAAALINQQLATTHGARIGFANATLYDVYIRLGYLYSYMLNDITYTDNCYQSPCGGANLFPATIRYDQASGLGSLQAWKLFLSLTPPVITSVNPTSGGNTANTILFIHGAYFLNPTVTVGGLPVTNLGSGGTSELAGTVPQGRPAGTVDVVVTNASGVSTTVVGGFTYLAPIVSGISPTTGGTDGGAYVTITGQFAYPTKSVTFGGISANLVGFSTTQIVLKTPPHSVGTVDISVIDANGMTTVANAYRYVDRPGPIVPGGSPAPDPGARPGPTDPSGTTPDSHPTSR